METDLDLETAILLAKEFQHEFLSPQRDKNLSDSFIARQLQEQFEKELQGPAREDLSDSILAHRLHEQFQQEEAVERPVGNLVYDQKNKKENTKSLVDPSWEVIDPTPDIHILFMAFNSKFFWSKLDSVCVSWSKKMKKCAGVCSYQGRGGLCHITLSEPLLKLRPRKDLIETLLHEMIHAYLFVTHNNRDRDGHGPEFHKHMFRINAEAGTNITVYHDFHDEVELYLQHWWRCDGPCQKWKPFFGIVRRSVNRAPGPNDRWWGQHSRNCGGTFIKIKSPEPKKKESRVKDSKNIKESKPSNDIRKFLPSLDDQGKSIDAPSTSGFNNKAPSTSTSILPSSSSSSRIHSISGANSGLSTTVTIQSKTNNIHGFSNSDSKPGNIKGATKNTSSTIVINKKTTTENKYISDLKTKTPNQNKSAVSDVVDYAVVRNHWINKFDDSSKNLHNSSNNKRKSPEMFSSKSKTPKLVSTSSQDSIDLDEAPCPICKKIYSINTLNDHLDKCLSDTELRECIVCTKMIEEPNYEQHVNECVKNTFDDEDVKDKSVILVKEDSMDVNTLKCKTCDNDILIDEFGEHFKLCKSRNKCPECGIRCETDEYDVHLAECLMKKLDEIENRFEKKEDRTDIVTINCLVCNKIIPKSSINYHLDDCLRSVFEKEDSQKNENSDHDKLYNCPFCLKLFSEVDMGNHIDSCLKTVDEDDEVENNKSVFLNEMD